MQKEPITIRRSDQTSALLGFARVTDAIRFKDEHNLGADFLIDDMRPRGDAGRQADLPVILGMTLRDALMPMWRATQMDRMLETGPRYMPMPVNFAEGLQAETALACMHALEDAGSSGWSAWRGKYFDPPLGPSVVRTHTDQPRDHAWVEHDSGLILDITRTIFDRLPVCVLTPEDDRHASFFARTTIDDAASSQVVEAWRGRINPALASRLHELGATEAISSPDETKDPVPGW